MKGSAPTTWTLGYLLHNLTPIGGARLPDLLPVLPPAEWRSRVDHAGVPLWLDVKTHLPLYPPSSRAAWLRHVTPTKKKNKYKRKVAPSRRQTCRAFNPCGQPRSATARAGTNTSRSSPRDDRRRMGGHVHPAVEDQVLTSCAGKKARPGPVSRPGEVWNKAGPVRGTWR